MAAKPYQRWPPNLQLINITVEPYLNILKIMAL